jgi:hypothetical protein
MRKAHRGLGLGAALALVAGGLLAMVTPTVASAAPTASPPCTVSASQVQNTARSVGIGGVIIAAGTSSTCQDPPPPPEPAFNGTPPLLFNGRLGAGSCQASPCANGDVMSTRQTGPLVIVPIFWSPSGYPFTAAYENLINQYIHDVAVASGRLTNVYSTLTEYFGNNGSIQYRFRAGPSIIATNPFPTTGNCTVAAADTSGIYKDGSGYTACLDDNNLQAEVDTVTATYGLPHNLSYIYEVFLPKHVEGCFFPGSDATNNVCTINNEPTAAYCAYHSFDNNRAVYSSMNYPIYQSATGFTCGTEARFPTEESPNNNLDADTEISPLSHETAEAVTDPDTQTGWYDSTGNENGDDCAYIYGATGGSPGHLFNQVINGHRYITQEEFTNRVFERSNGTIGCVQSWLDEFPGSGGPFI